MLYLPFGRKNILLIDNPLTEMASGSLFWATSCSVIQPPPSKSVQCTGNGQPSPFKYHSYNFMFIETHILDLVIPWPRLIQGPIH